MAKKGKAKPDSMLVMGKHLLDARKGVAELGVLPALDALGEREPALAGYIGEGLASMAGKLSLSGAPTDLVRAVHSETLLLILSSLEAQRVAGYELWHGTTFGTLLEDLAKPEPPPPAPKPARPRRKKKDG